MELTQELNEKYIIEGFAFVDGMEKPVCVTLGVVSIQRGEQAGLYFALSNGQSNAYDITSYLNNSIYDITLTKDQSAHGAVAFLQAKGNTEPLVFVGFEQTVRFNIN